MRARSERRSLPAAFFLSLGLCVTLLAGLARGAPASDSDTAALDPKLARILALARAGARRLALEDLDRLQPAYVSDRPAWLLWQRERVRLLAAERDLAGLKTLLDRLPADVPGDFRLWLETRVARVELAVGRPRAARVRVRRLIWSTGTPDARALRAWRRLVIQCYLAEGRVQDAYTAVVRFEQDYPAATAGWAELAARVMLRAGHPRQALKRLQGVTGPLAVALRLRAGLAAGRIPPEAAAQQARKALAQADLPVAARALYWRVLLTVAGRADRPLARLEALEQLAVIADLQDPGVSSDQLWQAYLAAGRRLGNARQLLLGQDEAWYFAATEQMQAAPRRARAMLAVLAERGQTALHRRLAHDQLARLCLAFDPTGTLLQALYLHNRRFPRIDTIPTPVRYRLVDLALARNDLGLASDLMAGLERPPAGTDPYPWQLRRARVLILAGQGDAGVAILRRMLAEHQGPWDGGALDRFIQVLFDLQKLDRHRAAIELFHQLLRQQVPARQHRELLFWIAQSQEALEHWRDAARYYLWSAVAKDPFSMDPWAQTARYQAARSLVRAGLYADAEHLYRLLLRVTKDPARRRVLEHDLRGAERARYRERAGGS